MTFQANSLPTYLWEDGVLTKRTALTPESSGATTPNALPTPTDPHLTLPSPSTAIGSPSSIATSTTTTAATTAAPSRRKRKATEAFVSPRPKELVPTEILSDDDDKDIRRKRNTAAARRYRQKKQELVEIGRAHV